MCISTGRATSIESLQGSELLLRAGSLETAAALMRGRLDSLQLAVERVNLGHDVEDTGVSLVVAGNLSRQTPIVRAACQLHGLVIGGRLP